MLLRRIYKKILREITNPYKTLAAHKQIKEWACQMNNDDVYILLSPLFGDFCYGMAYVSAFCEKMNEEGKKVTLLVPEKRMSLAECYSGNFRIISLSSKDVQYKRTMWILQRRKCIEKAISVNILPTIPWYIIPHTGKVLRDGLDILRNDIYKLGDNAPIEFPKVKNMPITSIDNFDAICNRVTIINPYSISMSNHDYSLFESIAEKLTENGYIVYTNVVGSQLPIKGTMPLNCSIFELYNICNKIPLVVSIRSGIVDFLITCQCKFFVVSFGKDNLNTHNFFNIWKLSAWNIGTVVEFIHKNKLDSLERFNNFAKQNLLSSWI